MFEASCATCCTYFCQISSNNLLVTLVCCIVLLGLLELLMVSLFSSCCTYISRTNCRFLVIILFKEHMYFDCLLAQLSFYIYHFAFFSIKLFLKT